MTNREGQVVSFFEVQFSGSSTPQCYVNLQSLTKQRLPLIPFSSAEEAWHFASHYPASADQVKRNTLGLCMPVGPLNPDTLQLAAGSISYIAQPMAYMAEYSFLGRSVHRVLGQRYYNGVGWKNEIIRRAQIARIERARGEYTAYEPLRDGPRDLKFCEHCKRPQLQMRKCSGCHWARYCSRNCQNRNWLIHKPICGPETSFQQLGFSGIRLPSRRPPSRTVCGWHDDSTQIVAHKQEPTQELTRLAHVARDRLRWAESLQRKKSNSYRKLNTHEEALLVDLRAGTLHAAANDATRKSGWGRHL